MNFLLWKNVSFSLNNAFVLINCDENQEDNIIEDLEKIRDVEYVEKTMGAYGIVVKVNAENNNKLKDVIKNKIKEIKNIHHTLTLMELLRVDGL